MEVLFIFLPVVILCAGGCIWINKKEKQKKLEEKELMAKIFQQLYENKKHAEEEEKRQTEERLKNIKETLRQAEETLKNIKEKTRQNSEDFRKTNEEQQKIFEEWWQQHCNREKVKKQQQGINLAAYYRIFGLTPETLTAQKLKAAYRSLCLKYHPDCNKAPDAAVKFDKVQRIYSVLQQELELKNA